MKALIIVDVQYDFLPGGALAVADGDKIIDAIKKIRDEFKLVIFTQDYHPKKHCSFKENGGIWPPHCVQNTNGAMIHNELIRPDDIVVTKGVNVDVDSYSGFYDNERKYKTELDKILKDKNVDTAYVCGLATDYCVKFTALDAVFEGYTTFLVADACKGVNVLPGDIDKALAEMAEKGIACVNHCDI